MRKLAKAAAIMTVAAIGLTGCGGAKADGGFDTSADITVLSREDGSGTRGAFIELFGLEEENEQGEKVDTTTSDAGITNSTSVMMSSVAQDPSSIGYISLGSLNDTVKAVEIDGVEASAENVENGTYKVVRPFNIVVKEEKLSPAASDFIRYINSAEGQEVVSEAGYISIADQGAFQSDGSAGKVVIGGSSSVSPVMEKLVEGYEAMNKKAEIELQTTDSTTGISSAAEGIYDIGMASRELKEEEANQGVKSMMIAQDGIAVIVNNENTLKSLTTDEVKNIFNGKTAKWSEIVK